MKPGFTAQARGAGFIGIHRGGPSAGSIYAACLHCGLLCGRSLIFGIPDWAWSGKVAWQPVDGGKRSPSRMHQIVWKLDTVSDAVKISRSL